MSYCDLPQFYSISEPRARKVHKCCECSAPILTGEKYVRCVGSWDGDFSSFAQHETCAQACEMIRDEFNGECIAFGDLFEFFGSELGWQMEREKKRQEPWANLRGMLAQIRRRERSGLARPRRV